MEATGQVASEEPRPISTTRHPFFAAQRDEHSLGEIFDPAASIFGLVCLQIKANDFRSAQTSSKAGQQPGPIPQAAQRATIKRPNHGDDIFCQDRFLLNRRSGMAVADAGHHRGDVSVLAIERETTLGIVPAEGGEA